MTPPPPPSVWNSLEVAKLVVGGATPVLVAAIGYWLSRILKRLELSQWRSQKLIERRMTLYDLVAPDLNKLLCYFSYVGTWKEFNPTDVIGLKRKLDSVVFVNEWLFSAAFVDAYRLFMDACFATYQGIGLNARLRTKTAKRKAARPQDWQPEWDGLFKEDDALSAATARAEYTSLMTLFAVELGVPERARVGSGPPSGTPIGPGTESSGVPPAVLRDSEPRS